MAFVLTTARFAALLLAFTAMFVCTEVQSLAQQPGAEQENLKRIVFLGDSLTEAFGLEQRYGFPARIAEKIKAAGLPYRVINAGIGGDTTSGGLQRLDWLLRNRIDVLVLALGANDGLRGLDLRATEQNLVEIITRTRKQYPKVKIVIAGMLVPPNLGKDYSEQFRTLFPRVAAQQNTVLIPFLLEGVAGEQALNQADGLHPSAEGYEIVAETVWKALKVLL